MQITIFICNLYCIVLYCIVLYCIVLYCIGKYFKLLISLPLSVSQFHLFVWVGRWHVRIVSLWRVGNCQLVPAPVFCQPSLAEHLWRKDSDHYYYYLDSWNSLRVNSVNRLETSDALENNTDLGQAIICSPLLKFW